MNLDDIRAQLEEEMTWRLNEMRLLRNQLSLISDEEDRKRYRKALIVMLYSHYEGFSKTALSIYAHAINQERIPCSDASHCVAAASYAQVFKDFENPTKKSDIFRRVLPDDTQLHRFARQVDLIASLDNIRSREVKIPIDVIVDTEMNLKPVVMRKILYRLGYPHDAFSAHEGKINLLLERRNGVAHGGEKSGLEQQPYEETEKAVYDVMDRLKIMIMQALRDRLYLKAVAP